MLASHDFLFHYACFKCKCSFKRPAVLGAQSDSAHRISSELSHNCPICNSTMAFMGRQFRPPKKNDSEKWIVVKTLWEAGFRFTGNGPTKQKLPETKSSVFTFIENNPDHPLKSCEPETWNG